MTRSVPDLYFYCESIDLKDSLAVLDSNGELHVGIESVVDKSIREGCFANRGLADCNEFYLVSFNGRYGIHNQYIKYKIAQAIINQYVEQIFNFSLISILRVNTAL